MKPGSRTRTPHGLEHAAELAHASHNARRALYLEVRRLLAEQDADALSAWASGLTDTNCDWRLYEVGQQILRARQAAASRVAGDDGED